MAARSPQIPALLALLALLAVAARGVEGSPKHSGSKVAANLRAAPAAEPAGDSDEVLPLAAVRAKLARLQEAMARFPECQGKMEYYCNANKWNCRGYGPGAEAGAHWAREAQQLVFKEPRPEGQPPACPSPDEYVFLDTKSINDFRDLLECAEAPSGPQLVPVASSARPRLHYLTVATEWHFFLALLLRSAEAQGLRPTVLGYGDPRFVTHRYIGGVDSGMKVEHVRNALAALPETDVVLFTDAFDVIAVRPLGEELLAAFESFRADVVVSAEKNCYPDATRASDYPLADRSRTYPYLNSGGYMGRVWALRWLMHSHYWRLRESDQRFFTSLYLRHAQLGCGPDIVIDHEARIFQTMNVDGPQLVRRDGPREAPFVNSVTGSRPFFLHFAGPYKQYIPLFYAMAYRGEAAAAVLALLVAVCVLVWAACGVWRRAKAKSN